MRAGVATMTLRRHPRRPGRRPRAGIVLAAVPSALADLGTAHIRPTRGCTFMWVSARALSFSLSYRVPNQTDPAARVDGGDRAAVHRRAGRRDVFDIRTYLVRYLALNVVAVFIITPRCHGELARTKPDARHLTAFYMWCRPAV